MVCKALRVRQQKGISLKRLHRNFIVVTIEMVKATNQKPSSDWGVKLKQWNDIEIMYANYIYRRNINRLF